MPDLDLNVTSNPALLRGTERVGTNNPHIGIVNGDSDTTVMRGHYVQIHAESITVDQSLLFIIYGK